MPASKEFLNNAYDLDGHDDTVNYYDAWAESYDTELAANGYVTPRRCADALSRFAKNHDISVLDIGCGTGVSGKALADAGFVNISGCDVSPQMLAIARKTGVYQQTWLSAIDDPLPFDIGTYDAITAVGVIGTGAAPVSLLDTAISRLAPGGLFIVSLNDHALNKPEFPDAIATHVGKKDFSLLMREYGPHIPGKKLNADVFVIERVKELK